jgi:hypothetical protein
MKLGLMKTANNTNDIRQKETIAPKRVILGLWPFFGDSLT